MSARTYNLTVVGEPPREDREPEADLRPATGILAGIGISLLFWVKFIYTTQLGEWSAAHWSAWQINFWGLGKHLLDLPFKFSLPLLLWAGFYLREMLPKPKKRRVSVFS